MSCVHAYFQTYLCLIKCVTISVETNWEAKCRQHTGGRIGEQKASFIKTKAELYKNQGLQSNINQVKRTKELIQCANKSKEHINETSRNKKLTYQQGRRRRRHWLGTQCGITGEHGTNWQRHEGKQRLIHKHTNEGIRYRWREAGKGQVRGGTEKHLEGGTENLDATHEGNTFQNKTGNKREEKRREEKRRELGK